MGLRQLRREMTYEELTLWLVYFQFQRDQQAEQMRKARSRRR